MLRPATHRYSMETNIKPIFSCSWYTRVHTCLLQVAVELFKFVVNIQCLCKLYVVSSQRMNLCSSIDNRFYFKECKVFTKWNTLFQYQMLVWCFKAYTIVNNVTTYRNMRAALVSRGDNTHQNKVTELKCRHEILIIVYEICFRLIEIC